MCGRITLRTANTLLLKSFAGELTQKFLPRYNISPTQAAWVVRGVGLQRELVSLRFGFQTSRGLLINARSETAAKLPTFRDAFRSRRCLIPADGFLEWKRAGKTRQPYLIEMQDQADFALAGLWQQDSFVVLTTRANDLLAPLHERMPVILEPDSWDRWLDAETPLDQLPALESYPDEKMQLHPVSTRVNSATHDDPACLSAANAERFLF